jgi:CHAT domain-containing protein
MKVPQALRSAQIELRNNPRWSHPYFWAAFSAYGEWR